MGWLSGRALVAGLRCGTMLARRLVASAFVLVALGCGASHHARRTSPPSALGTAAEVVAWEGLARPDVLHTLAVLLVSIEGSGGSCPRVEHEGEVTTITGGCTDPAGRLHAGRARLRTVDGEVRARLRDFGDEDAHVWGRMRVQPEGERRFALDVRVESSAPMRDLAPGSTWLAIDAHGHRDAKGRWQVEGELAAEGRGRVRLRGTDIALDGDRCTHEPLAGRLALWSGPHRVEIRYDGASDCDLARTARWWRDGAEQGELEGIASPMSCAVGRRGGAASWGAAWLLLGLVGRRRWTVRSTS